MGSLTGLSIDFVNGLEEESDVSVNHIAELVKLVSRLSRNAARLLFIHRVVCVLRVERLLWLLLLDLERFLVAAHRVLKLRMVRFGLPVTLPCLRIVVYCFARGVDLLFESVGRLLVRLLLRIHHLLVCTHL